MNDHPPGRSQAATDILRRMPQQFDLVQVQKKAHRPTIDRQRPALLTGEIFSVYEATVDIENRVLVGGFGCHFFMFPYIGNNHPNWLIFFRGVETTNQSGTIQ